MGAVFFPRRKDNTIMKRFIAYLTLAVSGLLMIGATVTSIFVQSKSNIEYSDGRALVYRLSDTTSIEDHPALEDNPQAAKEIAAVMEERLKTAQVSNYDITTIGNDTIKVVLSEQTEENYFQIKTFLSFNGVFALGTETNTYATGDEFLTSEKIYIDFIRDYPTVVIPVDYENENFKAVIEEAKRINDTGDDGPISGRKDARPANDDEEEGKTYVYLAYNFVEGEDRFSEMISGNEDYNAKKAEKLLIKFDIGQIWFDDTEKSIASAIDVDPDGDGNTSYTDIKNATNKARFYTNLLNSEKLDYNVTFIYENIVPAYFESLISYGTKATIAWSRTLIAGIIGIAIINLLLVVFYRWGAVTIATFAIGSSFLGLLFSLIFSVELTLSGIVGFISVIIASISSGIIYMTKVKEECYRGRSLKKANFEGSKKSLLPIVDIHVALIVIGAVIYWLGGTAMISFAAAAVFGGLVSLLLNTLGLKGMMWLLTNTTKFIGKYEIIGVDQKKIPDLMNEEKQSYFGPYQDKDFTKQKKPIGIAAIVIALASTIAMISFGAVQGQLFNHGKNHSEYNYVYFETHAINVSEGTTPTALDSAYVRGVLDNTFYYINGNSGDAKLISYELETEYRRTEIELEESGTVEVTYIYYVAKLDSTLALDVDGYIDYRDIHVEGTLENIFLEYFETQTDDTIATASFKVGERMIITTPESGWVISAVSIAVGFLTLYFLLRYRLSRGLTSLLITALTGAVTLGFYVLTRVIVAETAIFALPLVIFITLLMSVIFMDKDREMAKDDFVRSKDNSYEKRNEIMSKANSLAFAPILLVGLLAGYLAIDFFGFGPSGSSLIYLLVLIGIALGALFVTTLFGPLAQLLFKWFSRTNIKIAKPKKKKKLEVKTKKSAEPEEAIFIGIND